MLDCKYESLEVVATDGDGDDGVICLLLEKFCGETGKTQFATCLHKGHAYSMVPFLANGSFDMPKELVV